VALQDTKVYSGIYAAMATAVTEDGKVDRQGVINVANSLLDTGINGLSILGTTGECNGLTRSQRLEVLEIVLEATSGRGTIFTGAAGTVASEIVEDLKAADRPGVSGALVPPPFYYNLDSRGVVQFYSRLAEESPMPIILYNIPQATKVPVRIDALEQLAPHPNILGIKDSSGDFINFTQYADVGRRNPGFTVLTGADPSLFAGLMVGGHGLIGGGVNVVARQEVQLFEAWKNGDYDKAVELQQVILKAVDLCKAGPQPAGYKAPHVLRGLCGPYMLHPVQFLNEKQMETLRVGLTELGVL
jgi:dihydrodipicolinate synthase/N-acetylneuraminate lyase